jgi:hypothetical protein
MSVPISFTWCTLECYYSLFLILSGMQLLPLSGVKGVLFFLQAMLLLPEADEPRVPLLPVPDSPRVLLLSVSDVPGVILLPEADVPEALLLPVPDVPGVLLPPTLDKLVI